jgi:hypothetical protein
MKQNAGMAGSWGQNMDSSLASQAQYAQGLEDYYRAPMNQAASQLAQTPGYTDQELQNILGTQQYQSGMTTPDQYAALDPTQTEQAGMAGNPNSLYNYFNPDQLNQVNSDAAQAQRSDYGTASQNINNALSGQQQANNGALNSQESELRTAVLPALQGAYNTHAGNVGTALGNASSSINASVNNPNLGLNLKPEDYLMSNDQVQQMENQASQAVQNSGQTQMDAIKRAAAASGNSDPMAIAALQFQNNRQSLQAGADAQTNAALAAQAQQRQLAMNYAGANLGAAQTQAGMNVGAQENMASQNVGAEQNLLAQQNAAANSYEGMQMNLTGQQLSANNALAGNQMQGGQYLGSTGVGMEQGIGQQAQNTGQYVTNTGTSIAGNVNQLQTQNANQQYQTRLQNAMYGQQNTFNQNTAVQDRQSAAYQSAANARQTGQNNFLNWATGQTGQAVGQQQTANQQRIGAAGTALGAMNTATGQWGQYDVAKSAQPNWFDKTIGAAAGAAAGFAKAGAGGG